MSHMAAIDLHVKNLDDLEEACKVLGLELRRNQTNWRWWGSWANDYHAQEAAYNYGIDPKEYGKCAEHVITIPGDDHCYEIGIVARRDGKPGWMLMYDFYGSQGKKITDKIKGMSPELDKEGKPTGKMKEDRAGLLKQAYTMACGARMMRNKGFSAQVVRGQKQGHLQVQARRPKAVRTYR